MIEKNFSWHPQKQFFSFPQLNAADYAQNTLDKRLVAVEIHPQPIMNSPQAYVLAGAKPLADPLAVDLLKY